MELFKAGNVGKCALQSKSTMDKKKKKKRNGTHIKYGPQCKRQCIETQRIQSGVLRFKIDTVPFNQILKHVRQSDLRQRAANWCKIRFDVNE